MILSPCQHRGSQGFEALSATLHPQACCLPFGLVLAGQGRESVPVQAWTSCPRSGWRSPSSAARASTASRSLQTCSNLLNTLKSCTVIILDAGKAPLDDEVVAHIAASTYIMRATQHVLAARSILRPQRCRLQVSADTLRQLPNASPSSGGPALQLTSAPSSCHEPTRNLALPPRSPQGGSKMHPSGGRTTSSHRNLECLTVCELQHEHCCACLTKSVF